MLPKVFFKKHNIFYLYLNLTIFFPTGYLLTVTARDSGVPSLSDTTDVEISVVDVNDNEPVFKQQLYSATVVEDALVGKFSCRKDN